MNKVLSNNFQALIKEINTAKTSSLIKAVIAGIIGVLWPLGGVLLYGLSRISEDKLFGKLALIAAVIVMVVRIVSQAFLMLIM